MASGYPDWLRAIALLGQDPDGNPVLIQVDGDGQLVIPIQGVLNGTLTTVAVDEDGYLAAYILDDESQWGDVVKVGNAELAARLGSPQVWDWRGQTLYIEDFASGKGIVRPTLSGTGAAMALSPLYALRGGYTLKLTGGSDASRYAQAWFAVPYPPSSRIGLQTCVAWDDDVEFVRLDIYYFDGSKYYLAAVRFDETNHKLQYQDSGAAWQDIASLIFNNRAENPQLFKLVADFNTHTYLRCLLGSTEYDLSAYAVQEVGGTAMKQVRGEIECHSEDGKNGVLYLDHVLLTVNEPT